MSLIVSCGKSATAGEPPHSWLEVRRRMGAGQNNIPIWGGGEQVGLGVGVVLLFLECSLCPIETWQQWGGRELGDVGLPLGWTIYAGTQWRPRGQGYLRFLWKWRSGQITLKTNKPRVLMMSLSLNWMFFLFPLHTEEGGQAAWATVCFHYCPCRFYLRSLDTALFFYSKRIKTAPDTSIPTRGIEKHLVCRLHGLPQWMSASDEGEKNDALYGHCKKPFIQPQLSHRECVALTHGG